MLNPHSRIAAIVPAYNEEPTIGGVIRVLSESGLFRDVIAVIDGSVDGSAECARQAGASQVIETAMRQGKGRAMLRGAKATEAPLLFFLDADLLGLTQAHLKILLDPIEQHQLDMVVGLRDRGAVITWLGQFLPLIGGERILNREILFAIPLSFMEGYRVETAINAYHRSHGLRIGTRKLPHLQIRRKMQKFGFWPGLKAYLSMTKEMLEAWWLIKLAQLKGQF